MKKGRTYIAIDLKSFYASVECVQRGLDPLTTRLVVADESRTDKTICLAVTPALKAYGIKGRPRLFEVVQKVRALNRANPDLHLDYLVAKPRMSLYIAYSTRIYQIYLKHVAKEDIHVYSIDEVFMDVTSYLSNSHMTAHEMALKIVREVVDATGITATAGIGSNLYLAKVAMDIVAKRMPADEDGVRIAELDEMSYRQKLWNHRPLTDFWRIGRGVASRLQLLGIETMGQLARYSLSHEEVLYREFGVNAELLIDHAWGWEPCTMAAIKAYRPETHSMSKGQVLTAPYTKEKTRIVLTEMADQVALDLVEEGKVTGAIHVYIGYDRESLMDEHIRKQYRGPISQDHYGRQVPKSTHSTLRLGRNTSSSQEIVEAAIQLFDRLAHPALLIRRLNFTVLNLLHLEEAEKLEQGPVQLDLFTDYEALEKQRKKEKKRREKEKRMQEAIIRIKKSFGKNALLKGTSFTEGATARERNGQIGGHHK